jgi:Phage integrase, N-terminal SAM-like domain
MAYVEDLKNKRQGAGRLRWRVRYRDPAGRERARSFARKVDAERFLRHVEADLVRGQWVDPDHGRTTVEELADRWFATTATLKPKTREDYRSLLDNHVLPAFGDRPVASIDTLAIRGWLAALVTGGLSASRAKDAYYVLFAVLEAAIQAGALLRNPAAGVRAPRSRRRETQFLSAAEVERLAEAIVPPYGLLVRFAAYTGLRAGELVALRVKRLDLLRGTVRVVESASESAAAWSWGRPRRTRSARFGCLGSSATIWPCTWPAGPVTLMGSCSRRPRVGRCGITTSISARSARRWLGLGCRRRSASMICGIPARPC